MRSFTTVSSSTVDKVVWVNNTLIVLFMQGSVYIYKDVPETVFDAFEQAPSKGKFLNQEIVNKFETLRLA